MTRALTLEQALDVDRVKFPAQAHPDNLQAILAAIGPQPAGCKLSKRNSQIAHSPQNSRWMPEPVSTKAELRAVLQDLVFGKPKP